jgi:hypothetical protein
MFAAARDLSRESLKVKDLGTRVEGVGCKVQSPGGSGFKVKRLRFRI